MSKGVKGKRIDRLKYLKVKYNKLKNMSDKQALLQAGYSEATAGHHASEMTVLKRVKEEIEREFKAENINVQQVLKEIELGIKLSLELMDMSAYGFFIKLKGQYLAMFTEKQQIDANILTQEEQSILSKYISGNRLANKQ